MNLIEKSHNHDKWCVHLNALRLLVCIFWGLPLITFVRSFISRLPIISDFSYPIIYLFITVVTLIAIKPLIKSISFSQFLIWSLIIMVCIIEYVIYPENTVFEQEYIVPFFFSISTYFFLGIIIDIDKDYKLLFYISACVVITMALYSIIYKTSVADMSEDNKSGQMYNAYLILPHVIMCVWMMLKKFDLPKLILSLIGIFLLISYGTRGALLMVLLFILTYILIIKKSNSKKWLILTFVIIAIVFNIFYVDILEFFRDIISEIGMSTRIIDLLLGQQAVGGASVDERLKFGTILWPLILDGPFWGNGLCSSWRIIGTYPHNIFYELTYSFGLIPGAVILSLLVILFIIGFKHCNNDIQKGFWLLLLLVGFVKLFLSYTILNNYETFILIGYCVKRISTVPVVNKNLTYKKVL